MENISHGHNGWTNKTVGELYRAAEAAKNNSTLETSKA
jgi:hypothetical protein